MSERAGDLADVVARLAGLLRAAGVPVDVTAANACTTALTQLLPDHHGRGASRTSCYWVLRICLVRDQRHLATFDRIVAELLSGRPSAYPSSSLPATPEGRRRQGSAPGQVPVVRSEAALPWATRGNPAAEEAPGGAGGRSVPEPAPSRTHGLDTTPFDALDPASLELLAARLKESRKWPRRRTRRGIPGQPGRIDLRRTAAAWCRTAGEPLHLARVRPRLDRRRLVVLCDVSESMRPYAAAYLHLMRAVSAQGGETFAFATRLTRLSPVLARHSPEVAVELASRRVADRFGGTRIASSLRDLLGSHHGEVLRGAICVIASDGWDTDPPDQLAHELGRLARRAHRVVWLNPRAGESGYEPLVAGMAAALPYCDAFVPARTFADLSRGLDAIVGERTRQFQSVT